MAQKKGVLPDRDALRAVAKHARKAGCSAEVVTTSNSTRSQICREMMAINGWRCLVHDVQYERGMTTVTQSPLGRVDAVIYRLGKQILIVPPKELSAILDGQERKTVYLYRSATLMKCRDDWIFLK